MIEYGHINVKSPFNLSFVPSLYNISKIGSPSEIIDIFADVYCIKEIEYLKSFDRHSQEIIQYVMSKAESKALKGAISVLNCCCDKDPSDLIGIFLDEGDYIEGAESQQNIIELAKILLKNGVCGKSKRKSTNDNSKKSSEFNAIEYINMARIHLELDLNESKSMTMTELIMLMEAKYPDQKDKEKPKFNMNKEAYDKKMAAAKKLQDKIIAQRGKR